MNQLDFSTAPRATQRLPFCEILEYTETRILGFKIFGSWESEVVDFLFEGRILRLAIFETIRI